MNPIKLLERLAAAFSEWLQDAPVRMPSPVALVDASKIGDEYPYVFVEEDGSVRELHAAERAYLETPFSPIDGARPYTKWRHGSRAIFLGKRAGYLARSRLWGSVAVLPAPLDDPFPPESREQLRARLISEGHEIVDNEDGSFTAFPPGYRRRV